MAGPHTGCGCMTSKTGSLIFGWLEVVVIVPVIIIGLVVFIMGLTTVPYECPHTNFREFESVVNSAQFYMNNDRCIASTDKAYFTVIGLVAMAVGSLYLIAPCLLIHGVSNEKPSYIIPYIILSVLRNIGSFILLIGASISVGPVVLLSIVIYGIEVWRTVVVSCHYNYLSSKPKDDNELLMNKGGYVNL